MSAKQDYFDRVDDAYQQRKEEPERFFQCAEGTGAQNKTNEVNPCDNAKSTTATDCTPHTGTN